ncbi:MAG: DMT family transporter [Aestuariivirgaceae bacterium]|nr:DMT family transporter [Aestuariivirgaceae bacterium]
MPESHQTSRSIVTGIYLSVAAFVLFAAQDAAVKWLVAGVAVAQILFVRSLTIVAILTVWKGVPLWRELAASPHRRPLLLRGVLLLSAWMCFYNAARYLQLAELTVIYYGSPLIVTLLSVPILRERVPPTRWAVTALGFTGVLVACLPHDASQPLAMALAGVASFLWAMSMLLMRSVAGKASSFVLSLSQNATLLLGCAFIAPFLWAHLPLTHYALMIAIGMGSGMGQFLMFEAAKRAPASVMAPMEYSSLLWAFLLGFVIWGDVPPWTVFAGGGLIILSGLTMLLTESRRVIVSA